MQELRYSLHMMRKSALLMAGLVVLVLFVGVALRGPSLVPHPAYDPSLSTNQATPSQGVLVTTSAFPRNATSSSWVNVSYALVEDRQYASSSHLGDTLLLTGFWPQLSVSPPARVTALKIGVKYFSDDAFDPSFGDVPSVAVSWDGGQNWSQEETAPVKISDDGAFSYLDFTNAHAWDAQQVNRSGVTVRITHVAGPGTRFAPLYVDAALLQVTFQALQTPPNGMNAAQGLTALLLVLAIMGVIVLSVALLLRKRRPRKPAPASPPAAAPPPREPKPPEGEL